MKLLIAALLSVAIFVAIPKQNTPINNSGRKPAHSISAEKPAKAEKAATVVIPAEKPEAQQVVVQSEPASEPEPLPAPIAQPAPVSSSEAEAKAFIYAKESGNDPTRVNSIGCFGIGQDCNGIVKNKCGTDYQCQDDYFTDYMLRRYGSWTAAKAFWLARVTINGQDVGHWW